MVNRGALLGDLRRWILGGGSKKNSGSDCKVLQLVHKDGDGHLKPVGTWEIGTDVDFDELATTIIDSATRDAVDGEEEELYILHAYFGEARPGSAGYGERHRFKIFGTPKFEEGMDVSSSSSSLTTPKQMTAAMGKMMLDHHKLTVPWANQLMLQYQRQVDTLQSRVISLEAQVQRGFIIQERLVSRQHERQLRLRKVIFWEKQKEEMAGIVIPMIPTLFNAMAGKQLAAPRKTDYTEALKQFVVTIGSQPEKMQKLQGALKMQQYGPIAAIVDAVQNGKPIDPVVVGEFMKPVDNDQMRLFQQILSEEEFQILGAIHHATYEEYERRKAQLDAAVKEAENEMEEKTEDEPEPLDVEA